MTAIKYGIWKCYKFKSNYDHLCREKMKYDEEDVTKKRKWNRGTPRTAGMNKMSHLQTQRKSAQIWQ
jgi:hypothetical protein